MSTARARVVEYAPSAFYLEVAKIHKHWLTGSVRVEWQRVKDWQHAYFDQRGTVAPDRVFKSIEECEQYIVDTATYPRVVKEFA